MPLRLTVVFFLQFIALFSFAQHVARPVKLTGTIRNANNNVLILDQNATGFINPYDAGRRIIPDSNGHFSAVITIKKEGYYRIGRNLVYLRPGDNCHMDLDYENELAASFGGSESELNTYLRKTPYPNAGSYLNGGLNIKSTIGATIDTILRLGKERQEELEKHQFSARVMKLERMRLKADMINSFKKIFLYYPMVHKTAADSLTALKEKITKAISPYIIVKDKSFVDADYLNLLPYTYIMYDYVNDLDTVSVQAKAMDDWARAVNIAGDIRSSDSRSNLIKLKEKILTIGDSDYRELLTNLYESKLRLNEGDPAIDIKAEDQYGNAVKLSAFKDKIVVIDLWATWCGPCLKENPIFKTLAESYQNQKNIVFISLSIDDNKNLWRKKVQGNKGPLLQWNTKGNFITDYNINGVPRTIIIKNGLIIAKSEGPLPSSPELSKFIEMLLKS